MTRREIQRAGRQLAYDYGAQLGYTMNIEIAVENYDSMRDATNDELNEIEQYYSYTLQRFRKLLVM